MLPVFIKAARNLRRFETDPRTELSRWSWNYPLVMTNIAMGNGP